MNKSHVTGRIDQAVGKLKQAAGDATDNQKLANEGAAQQVKGAAKETWGNLKDFASEAGATAWSRMKKSEAGASEKSQESSQELRDKVISAAQNAKHNIADKLDNLKKKQEEKHDDDVRKAS